MDASDVSNEAFERWLANHEAKTEQRRARELRQMLAPFTPWDQIRARMKCGDAVWARIRKANPDHRGIKAGNRILGWHPHDRLSRAINLDVVGPKEFIARFGREAYRNLPRTALIRHGHRKAISATYAMDLPRPVESPQLS